jgi:hypothetical protein
VRSDQESVVDRILLLQRRVGLAPRALDGDPDLGGEVKLRTARSAKVT